MKPDFVALMQPLGLRLEAAARALAAARQQAPAWLVQLDQVWERAAQSPLVRPDRFARVEASGLHSLDGPAPATGADDAALPDGVRARLRAQVGPAADRLRVHDNDSADRLARAHGADAVSIGDDVYFARGRYQPHDATGFALLAHEAVHVEHATRPGAPWQRSGAAALAAEEVQAHAVERALRRGAAVGMPAASPARSATPAAAPLPAPVAAPGASAATRPMTAAADRGFDTASAGSGMDMDALRQSLMHDLMRQLRADMERGG